MRTHELVDHLRWREGIARSSSLLRAGATRSDLRRAVASGAVMRVRDGIYALPHVDPLIRDAALHGGGLACASRLRALGVWVLEDTRALHVWMGSNGRSLTHAGCSCVSHYDAGTAGVGSVSVAQALVQLAGCCGPEAFFAAFESAWRLGLLSKPARAEVRAGLRAGMRWLVDIARGDADSGLESILRLRLRRLGITLTSQVVIPGVGIVDFVLDGILILEVDGRENHDGPSLRHKDLVRDALSAALGYDTLRFDYTMILHQWEVVEKAILARREMLRGVLSRRSL